MEKGKAAALGKVLAISNEKGGVGKTSAALNLALVLSRRGRRVLVVDLDPQDCVRQFLCLPEVDDSRSMTYALAGGVAVTEIVIRVAERFDVVPAGAGMRHVQGLLEGQAEAARGSGRSSEEAIDEVIGALARVLAPARAAYDVIIVDTAPTLGVLLGNALQAADGVLIPFVPQLIPFEQSRKTLRHAVSARKYINPSLEVVGMLPFAVRSRVTEDQEVLALALKEWGAEYRVFPGIPQSAEMSTRFSTGAWSSGEAGSESARAAVAAYEQVGATVEAWCLGRAHARGEA